MENCIICHAPFLKKGDTNTCSLGCERIKLLTWSNCEVCGKEYQVKHRRKVCSDECGKERSYQQVNKTASKCIVCGKDSNPKYGFRVCSNKCKEERQKDNYDKKALDNCVICNQEFKSKYGLQVCSDKCKKERSKNYYHKKSEIKERKCKTCGTFFPPSHGSLYCSEPCRSKGMRQYERDYYHNHRKHEKTTKTNIKNNNRVYKVEEKKCGYCGEIFSGTINTKYCPGKNCATVAQSEKQKEAYAKDRGLNPEKYRVPRVEKRCSFCDNIFIGTAIRKYCTDNCKDEARKQKQIIYRKNYYRKTKEKNQQLIT